ncbi:YncE family protein [Bacillus salacetis]|uniref:YncE family protein n=1 Tax=Bacillus salacetis TaxID=2315464 RepID=UPI003B9E88DF
MNKILLFALLSLVLIISGCQNDRLAVPENAEDTLMVSHLKDPSLTFIDKETQKVMDTVELDETIADMVRIDDEHIAYISKDSGTLNILNTADGNLKQWEDIGAGVNELLYSDETRQLFLSASGGNQVKVFNINEEKVTAAIPVGKFPLSMALDEQAGLLFVVNQKGSSVSVIDANELEVTREFLVPYLPEGIWFKDSKLYVGGHGPVHGDLNRFVYVIDPESGGQLDRIEVGLMPVKFFSPPASKDLYVVCHGSHELYKIAAYRGATEKVKVGANPYDVTGNKDMLYVSSIDSNSLFILDLDTFDITSEIDIDGGPVAIIEGGGSE